MVNIIVCDYIAGMTGRYAVAEHSKLFGKTPHLRLGAPEAKTQFFAVALNARFKAGQICSSALDRDDIILQYNILRCIMYTVKLRTVGGSVMFAIPKPMLEGLILHANQQVGVSISGGRIIIEPKAKPRYTLTELLAQCNLEEPMTAEDREWLAAPPVGREAI